MKRVLKTEVLSKIGFGAKKASPNLLGEVNLLRQTTHCRRHL